MRENLEKLSQLSTVLWAGTTLKLDEVCRLVPDVEPPTPPTLSFLETERHRRLHIKVISVILTLAQRRLASALHSQPRGFRGRLISVPTDRRRRLCESVNANRAGCQPSPCSHINSRFGRRGSTPPPHVPVIAYGVWSWAGGRFESAASTRGVMAYQIARRSAAQCGNCVTKPRHARLA